MSKEKFFRIKMSPYTIEGNDGGLKNTKKEFLVMSSSYTEAEKLACVLMEESKSNESPDYEIIKTKIGELLYNDLFTVNAERILGLVHYYFESENTEEGIYSVFVEYTEINESNGKEKIQKETIYTPAQSPKHAIDYVNDFLKDVRETRDWSIKKVDYDKADEVLVTESYHKRNLGE